MLAAQFRRPTVAELARWTGGRPEQLGFTGREITQVILDDMGMPSEVTVTHDEIGYSAIETDPERPIYSERNNPGVPGAAFDEEAGVAWSNTLYHDIYGRAFATAADGRPSRLVPDPPVRFSIRRSEEEKKRAALAEVYRKADGHGWAHFERKVKNYG